MIEGLQKYIKDVTDLDKEFNLTTLQECTSENLSYMTLCMVGEAGEVANEVKKLQRDGESEERWQKFEIEMVDLMIYFCEILNMTQIDFDAAWEAKHVELYQRFRERGVNATDIGNRKFKLRG